MQQNTSRRSAASAARRPGLAFDAPPTDWSRFWAVAVLASTVAVALVALLGAPEIIRTPITLWFIAICPGMAIVRLLRLDQPIAELMLALALSLALDGLIPAIFLYVGAWSPAWSLTTLVVIAGTAWVLDLAMSTRRTKAAVPGHARPPVLDPVRLAHGPSPTSGNARSRIPWQAVGSEELVVSESTVSLRSALDLVIGDLADRRQRDA